MAPLKSNLSQYTTKRNISYALRLMVFSNISGGFNAIFINTQKVLKRNKCTFTLKSSYTQELAMWTAKTQCSQ